MKVDKRKLLAITRKITEEKPVSPGEIASLSAFERKNEDSKKIRLLKSVALPASLTVSFFFAAFPDVFSSVAHDLPAWTNLPPEVLAGVDYFWDIIGEPVGKANIIFHIPNVFLYSFGILGLKKIVDSIDRKTWADRVIAARKTMLGKLDTGMLMLQLAKGHSLLFVGSGDFIGMQFVLNHQENEAVTISQLKPSYTKIWQFYDAATLYEDLKNVIVRSDGKDAGEYIFFPVKDDQIFLPNEKAYDLSPHKLDILCLNIRTIEKELRWTKKRIIIIGDKFHKSYVQSEDRRKVIPRSADTITLESLAKKYDNVTLLDPSDIVLKKIIRIAEGRKIVFRATKEGIREYKERFYDRLKMLGYRRNPSKKGILTIGYDLFEDQTEQQTLARKIDDYYPVVLSKNVRDALIRNGYKPHEFLYVPELVLSTLSKTAAEQ